ncbi:MAG: phosphoribosylamine--glycine ligase [Candidatus Aenigmatarchaeota archaeon]
MTKDSVMVIGSGGREHAMAWKLAQSPHVGTVFVAPGNGGTAKEEKCKNIPELKYSTANIPRITAFAKENSIALTVVGPEQPLVDGIADVFLKEGLNLFGPGTRASMLEGDKIFAKNFMAYYDVPTARYNTAGSYETAIRHVDAIGCPVYVKASGLAAGKGALPGRTTEEANQALRRIMVNREFGDAGNGIVIEKFLQGEETSCMALINSLSGIAVPLLPSQDHKKLLDGDEGPNTGGMGAYAPTRLVTPELQGRINNEILLRTNIGIARSASHFTGFLYPGLMITDDGPMVLEYNVRMGDPETQPILTMMKSDFYEALQDVASGRMPSIEWRNGYAVCVVLAAKGYPESPEKGKPIEISVKDDNVKVFHAGTTYRDNDTLITSGGRVLGVTAYGDTIERACDRAYAAVDEIHFEGRQFRRDIGLREVMRK